MKLKADSVAGALAIFLALFTVFYVLDCTSARPVSAQAVSRETQLVLAQTFVLEAGFDAATDHAAIAHVMLRKATRHNADFQKLLVRYVAGFKMSTPRTRWVRELNFESTKPLSWPVNLAWSAHVDRWQAVLERANQFLLGNVADPCHGRAEQWGGNMDRARAAHIGLVEVDCGDTKNTFYTRGSW